MLDIVPNWSMLLFVWGTAAFLYVGFVYTSKYITKQTGNEEAQHWAKRSRGWVLRGLVIVCLLMSFFTGWNAPTNTDTQVVPLNQVIEAQGLTPMAGENSKQAARDRLAGEAAKLQEDQQESLDDFRHNFLNKDKEKDQNNEDDS
jgi:hypothetical protein